MRIIHSVKKLFATSCLAFGLLVSSNAYALPTIELGSLVANWASYAEDIVSVILEGYSLVEEKISNAIQSSSWVKNLKTGYEKLKSAKDASDKLLDKVEGLSDISSIVEEKIDSAFTAGTATDNSSWTYAKELPSKYIASYSCTTAGRCTTNRGAGFEGAASGVSSDGIRESYRAAPRPGLAESLMGVVLPSVGVKGTALRYAELGESNAQEIAVINAMALEGYKQASNRIARITELRTSIATLKGTNSSKNNLKRVADLQAQLLAFELNLSNEQAKLTSLSILQQSQRDGFKQRKKELLSRSFRTLSDETAIIPGFPITSLEGIRRTLILGASYSALQILAAGSDPADPNAGSNFGNNPNGGGQYAVNVPVNIQPGGTINSTLSASQAITASDQATKEAFLTQNSVGNARNAAAHTVATNAHTAALNVDAQTIAESDREIDVDLQNKLDANTTERDTFSNVVQSDLDTKEADTSVAATAQNATTATAGTDRIASTNERVNSDAHAASEQARIEGVMAQQNQNIVDANNNTTQAVGGLAGSVNNLANAANASAASSAAAANSSAAAANSAAAAAALPAPAPSVPGP